MRGVASGGPQTAQVKVISDFGLAVIRLARMQKNNTDSSVRASSKRGFLPEQLVVPFLFHVFYQEIQADIAMRPSSRTLAPKMGEFGGSD